MKRSYIIILSLIFIIIPNIIYADTTLNYSSSTSGTTQCPSEPWTPDGSWNPRTKYWIPSTLWWWSRTTWSVTCNTHYYYSSSDAPVSYSFKDQRYSPSTSNTNWVTRCPAWQRVVWWTNWVNWTIICRSYDDIPPSASDILWTLPASWVNLLATNSYNFKVNVSSVWWSPISIANSFFEDYNSTDSLKTTYDNCISPSWCTQNISNVDNDRKVTGDRDYKMIISKICDEAWNCLWSDSPSSNLKEYSYSIYANTLLAWGTKSVINEELTDNSNISDWTEKNMTIELKDVYWNEIIPASWIWRTIDFDFDVNNRMYLNQYERTWSSSVFLTSANWINDFTNKFSLWNNVNTLSSQNSSDWIYNYKFKVYTPTSNQDILYWPISDENSQLQINSINLRVNGNPWANSGILLSNSNINSVFNPLYYTQLSWEIKTNWFIEWATQAATVEIVKNSLKSTSNNKLAIEFWSWNTNQENLKLDMNYWSTSTPTNLIGEWNWYKSIIASNFSWWDIYNFFTKINLVWGAVLQDLQNSYFSTHLAYEIDWINVSYNSDLLGKNSYWWLTSWENTSQSALKILWYTYSTKDNYNEIIEWQDGSEVKRVMWQISKFWVKTDIRSKVYDFIKNVNINPLWVWEEPLINDLNNLSSNNWVSLLNNTVLYYWGLPSDRKIVNLWNWGNLNFNWNKTIVIEWGNLYIRSNILYSNLNSDVLWIIVLKDEAWNWGNIYIDPSVTQIHSILYADKSVISYDWVNELDWNTSFNQLKNQIYIFWSLFSENTIWGSRLSTPTCPYYLTSWTCDLVTAQKYDLNYLRRYYLVDTDTDWIPDSPAWSWIQVKGWDLAKYPVIIQYNPTIQSNPPPLFNK